MRCDPAEATGCRSGCSWGRRAAQERCLRWLVCHCGQRLSSAEPGVRLGFREGRGRWAVAYPPTAFTARKTADAGVWAGLVGRPECSWAASGWTNNMVWALLMYIPQPTGLTSPLPGLFGLGPACWMQIFFYILMYIVAMPKYEHVKI